LVDTNPYTDDVLLEIKEADRNDPDAAFAGVKAQVEWAASAPSAGAHVFRRAVEVMEATCPFGSEKNSGIGRFNGSWAIEAFTTDQWLTAQHGPRG